MGHLLKIKCIRYRVNVNIASTSVPFRPKFSTNTWHETDNNVGGAAVYKRKFDAVPLMITFLGLISDHSPHLFRFIHRKSKRRRFKRSPHGPMFVTGHELIDDTGDIAYDVAHKSLDVTSGQQHHSWSRYAHKYVWFDWPVNNAFHCRTE